LPCKKHSKTVEDEKKSLKSIDWAKSLNSPLAAMKRPQAFKECLEIAFVNASFVVLFLVFFPLLLLNGAIYNKKRRRRPFYKSFIVKMAQRHPRWFDLSMYLLSFPLFSDIYAYLPDLSGRILHIGCGTGLLNRYLNAHKKGTIRPELINLDTNSKYLHFGRQKKRILNAVCGNISAAPFRENSFDAVIFARCFHHIKNHKLSIEECAGILKKGGLIIIADPVSMSEKVQAPFMTNTYIDGMVWRYNQKTFCGFIASALSPSLVLEGVSFRRQKHITNFNMLFPHTDALAIVRKVE
jgi:ubiquinone/menaquinone biosynthesis C-methylase UbiE